MAEREVQRFRASTRWLHWIIVITYCTMFVTGLILFTQALGPLAAGSTTRLLHRIAVVIAIVAVVIYFLANIGASFRYLAGAFKWGGRDFGWLGAAIGYYFGGPESGMPPQPEMNTGQKLWWLMVVLTSIVFAISGFALWFFRASLGADGVAIMLILHDLAFIAAGCFLLVHIYLSMVHPRMTESLKSMFTGKISAHYAKSHYGLWYEEQLHKR